MRSLLWNLFFTTLLFLLLTDLHSQNNYSLTHASKKNPNFTANIINDICFDTHDRLYVATPTGAYHYNGSGFKPIEITTNNNIKSIINTYQDSLLIILTSGRVFKIESAESIKDYFYFPKFEKNLHNSNILFGPKNIAQHLIDSNITYNPYSSHIVWQNNKKRFLIRSGPQKKFFYLHSNLKQTKIRHIDSPNSFRFLYHKKAIFRLQHNHITNATNDKIKIALPVTNTNRIYFINKPEQPLCMVIDQSIWCLNQSKGKFEWELLTNKLPLQTIITAAAFNAKLHIWALGTQSDGLLIFKKNPFQILFPFNNPPLTNYYLQIPAHENKIITNGGYILSEKNTQLSSLKHINLQNNQIHINKENYLVNSDRNVYIFNSKTDNYQPILQKIDAFNLNYNRWNKDSILILSTDSIYLYEPYKKKTTPLFENKKTERIIYKSIRKNHELWVANCSGIDIFDFYNKTHKKNILKGFCIRDFIFTPQGILCAAYGEGIYLINPENFKKEKIPLDKNKSLLYPHSFYLNNKQIIIPTNNGLISVSIDNLVKSKNKAQLLTEPFYLNDQDGLPTNEFNGGVMPNYIKFQDSLVSFPCLKGLIQINPSNYNRTLPVSHLNINHVYLQGKTLKVLNNLVHLPTYTEQIQIDLDFNYWGNTLNLPLYYQYNNSIYRIYFEECTHLRIPLTHYGYENITFLTKTQSGKFIPLQKLTIYRNYLWYKEFHIWAVIIIVIWGLFFLYNRTRNMISELKNERLQAIINTKTEELQILNHRLNQKIDLLSIANQKNELYISVINHDIYAPIKYINIIGNQLNSNLSKFTKNIIIEHFNTVLNSTKRLEILCSNVLNLIHSDRLSQEFTESIDIFKLTTELKNFFQVGLDLNKNSFFINIPENTSIYTHTEPLNIILTNLIGNANRFTQNGQILISYKYLDVGDVHELSIIDTGRGISTNLAHDINHKNLKIANRISIEYQSYGIGYNLIFKMLEIINGNIIVERLSIGGTKVTVQIPNHSNTTQLGQ